MSVYDKLKELNITLPPVSVPAAAYVPYVQTGNLVFLSGHIARKDGKPWAAQFGRDIGTEEGKEAARSVAIDLMGTLQAACGGDLNRVKRIVKVMSLVNSTGDFTEALAALLGPNAKGLSAKTITRLKADWWQGYEAWQKRDLGNRRFLYIWADGVYFKPRMAEEKQCVLVIVGADEYGRKELLAMTDGFRESTQSWREVLLDLKRRGLKQDPKLAVGDGALGFWTALREVFATTREQRCWVHKTMNVLNAMPKSVQAKAKSHLHDIWQAETKAAANAAFAFFAETYGIKWDKAVAKLVKDRDALLTFYDYPAEHWKHIRTSNPIESTFATVRHRTKRTKGCLSRKTGLAMAFKLMMSAHKKWRKLDGQNRLPEIIQGIEFRDGIRQLHIAA